MSDLHSRPDNGRSTSTSGFLFDDWDLIEKSPAEDVPPFDGKIIARMPDLGSNGIVANIKKPKSPSLGLFWKRLRQSIASVVHREMPEFVHSTLGTRQQFFHRVTAFGGALLLCGVGLLCLDYNKKETTEDTFNITGILSENAESSSAVAITPVRKELAPPVVLPESNNQPSDAGVAIPVADFAAVQNSVASTAEQTDSFPAWNRPIVSSYSPFDVVPKQPEHSLPSPDVVAAVPPPVPASMTVTMVPMTPISESPTHIPTTSMPPTSMPVSPYERQLVAQSNSPVRPPVDPFIQTNRSPVPPGMMPMHERLENMVNAPSQDAQRSASVMPPYHPPLVAVQGGIPVSNSPQGQYSQYGPNVPIPSGVSTLPPQHGYYPQNPVGNFPPNGSQPYHRVY